jgi:hypothetical protein
VLSEQTAEVRTSVGHAAKDQIGELGYRTTPSGKRVWYVDIGKFSEMIPDDC